MSSYCTTNDEYKAILHCGNTMEANMKTQVQIDQILAGISESDGWIDGLPSAIDADTVLAYCEHYYSDEYHSQPGTTIRREQAQLIAQAWPSYLACGNQHDRDCLILDLDKQVGEIFTLGTEG